MADYTKPWLPIDEQIRKLAERGVVVPDRAAAADLLGTIGYYRLTGYLYPFRQPEAYIDGHGRERIRVTGVYRSGTSIEDALGLIDFDRKLRLLVLDAVEHIEIALRTRIGHTVGRIDAFAHEVEGTFLPLHRTEGRPE